VPFISGNSFKHTIREAGVDHALTAMGVADGSLTKPVVDLLFSGGHLSKSGSAVNLSKARALAELFPILGVCGYSARSGHIEIVTRIKPPQACSDGCGTFQTACLDELSADPERAGIGPDLVEGREIQIADKDGERDVRYGDIAILLRATTDSAIYEKELRDLDIPYFALRARGFYDKQEIADLVNFLVILEKPYLDIPLASVLRSPLAGLSEDALFWLTRVKENVDQTPLCEALRRKDLLEPLSPEDAGKLEAFTRLFDDLAGRKDKRRISSILIHAVEKTRYDAKILGKPEGKRKLANVKKLIDMARDFETREAFGLADFVRYVKKLSIQDVRESEAQVELEKGEAVKLLSIHKAKGLEFPVVVAADLGRALNAGESLPVNFTQKNGLGFKIKNEATGSWEEDFGYRKNKEFESVRERQELKRLFYVLLTRAEEHLILSGSAKEKDPEEKNTRSCRPGWIGFLRRLKAAACRCKSSRKRKARPRPGARPFPWPKPSPLRALSWK